MTPEHLYDLTPTRIDLPHLYQANADMPERCAFCPGGPDAELHTSPDRLAALVVLAFTDLREARVWAEHANAEDEDIPLSAEVVALYRVPTKFCDCSSDQSSGDGNKVKGWMLGKKFGWWVHRNCGKPSPSAGKHFGGRLFGALGYNLLSPARTDIAREFEAAPVHEAAAIPNLTTIAGD